MDYKCEFVLLDRDMVNALIKALHRPEPSGYGTLPGENMNVAWGVHERHTGITVVKASEPGTQNARATKRAGSGSFLFWAVFRIIRIFSKRSKDEKEAPQTGYDVMSREGCFGVCYDADEQDAALESAKVWGNGDTNFFEKEYLDAVKQAIRFYESEGMKNGAFERFAEEFEDVHKTSIFAYRERVYQEVCEEWKSKWKHS